MIDTAARRRADLRALAADGRHDGPRRADPQHASPDAESQFGGGGNADRPHPGRRRPGTAGRRRPLLSDARLGRQLRTRRAVRHTLPYVALPYTMFNVVQLPGQTPGYLGGRFDRFQVDGNPNAPNFQVSALERRRGPVGRRCAARICWSRSTAARRMRRPGRMRGYQERALELIASESVRTQLRHRTGRRRKPATATAGRSSARARCWRGGWWKAGVNVVAVFDGQHNGQDANWDSHTTLFPRHKQLIPPADRALSALIGDLEERGLLESTLVIVAWGSSAARRRSTAVPAATTGPTARPC